MPDHKTYDYTFVAPCQLDDACRAITSWAALNNITITNTNTGVPGVGAALVRPSGAPVSIVGTKGYRRHPPSLLRAWVMSTVAAVVAVFVVAIGIIALYGQSAVGSATATLAYTVAIAVVMGVVIGRAVRAMLPRRVQFQLTVVPTPLNEQTSTVRVWASKDTPEVRAASDSLLTILQATPRTPT